LRTKDIEMKNKLKMIIAMIGVMSILYSCKETTEEIGPQFDGTAYTLNIGNFPNPTIASDNALTEQGVKLGKMLFYEKMLSKDGTMSCASCHRQEHAFTDTAKFSTGVRGEFGGRQAMTIFNMAWHDNEFFWDGRAHLLRDQSLLPIQDELEMDESLENAVAKLKGSRTYLDQFIRAFGSDEITPHKMSLAMEQFMNSITSNNSRYDRYLAGKDSLSASEERGRELFFTEYNEFFPDQSGADCAHCHSGDNFSNNQYMNNGLEGDNPADVGRSKVTENNEDIGKFKVTSLRNIEVSGPYMHGGQFATLEEVVEHYNNGLVASNTLDPALEQTRGTGLRLSAQDKEDLVAFLKTLTDQEFLTNPEYKDPF
jgi:cytochrome c peroxidase